MISKFYFEDRADSVLSEFYRSGFEDDSHLVFTGGSGNLVRQVRQQLNRDEGNVVVFLNVIRDNPHTIATYNALRNLSLQRDLRCIVIPIVCMEFYYLCMLDNTHLASDFCFVRTCAWQWSPHPESVAQHKSENYCYLDRACKLACEIALGDCARISRKGDNYLHTYTRVDCPCECATAECVSAPADSKLSSYLKQFPCLPTGALGSRKRMGERYYWQQHVLAVRHFNHSAPPPLKISYIVEEEAVDNVCRSASKQRHDNSPKDSGSAPISSLKFE